MFLRFVKAHASRHIIFQMAGGFLRMPRHAIIWRKSPHSRCRMPRGSSSACRRFWRVPRAAAAGEAMISGARVEKTILITGLISPLMPTPRRNNFSAHFGVDTARQHVASVDFTGNFRRRTPAGISVEGKIKFHFSSPRQSSFLKTGKVGSGLLVIQADMHLMFLVRQAGSFGTRAAFIAHMT